MRVALLGAVAAVAVLVGCTSDGEVGENGVVRFSQVVHFAETDDFSAPLATKRSLLVALQRPVGVLAGADGETKAELTMEVRRDGKKVEDRAFPMGFGQYAVNLVDTGDYALVALEDGKPIDQVKMTVADQKHIRFSQKFVVATAFDTGTQTCSRLDEQESGLADFVLHSNQTITLFVVPESGDQKPMLGLLPITAHVPDGVFRVDAQLVGHGALANSLTLTPTDAGKLGTAQELSVKDEETAETIKLSLKTSADQQPIDCTP